MPAPVTQKGFTLIEMLVALGVFSIAVIALLNVQSQSVRTLSEIELRAFAHIVADNRMVETL
ncbi:MAG: type II secretion system minor pseudopilin GspI, partial [Alphaproteobacteria bacterium]|nr:type II secretion system minor pseudopilin GspI [Alphaproteobacteria bacterium]